MVSFINEVTKHFQNLIKEQDKLKSEAPKIDEGQFALSKSASKEESFDAAQLLSNSIILNASESEKVLFEKKFPFGLENEDIIDIAHPEPAVMADGQHTSGVVDNLNTQHEKILSMVNKQPTGNVFHDLRLASQVKALTSIADQLDNKRMYKEADEVEHIIDSLIDVKEAALKREAGGPLLGIAAAIVGLAGAWMLMGTDENVINDADDLISNMKWWKNDYPQSQDVVDRMFAAANDIRQHAEEISGKVGSQRAEDVSVVDKGLRSIKENLRTILRDHQIMEITYGKSLTDSFFLFRQKLEDLKDSLAEMETMALMSSHKERMKAKKKSLEKRVE